MKMGSRVIVFQPNGSSCWSARSMRCKISRSRRRPISARRAISISTFPRAPSFLRSPPGDRRRMPVVQGTINRGKGKYAIAYAFQPGDNGVRLVLPGAVSLESADAALDVSDMPCSRVMLVAPPTVQGEQPGVHVRRQRARVQSLYARCHARGTSFRCFRIRDRAPAPSASRQAGPDAAAEATRIPK